MAKEKTESEQIAEVVEALQGEQVSFGVVASRSLCHQCPYRVKEKLMAFLEDEERGYKFKRIWNGSIVEWYWTPDNRTCYKKCKTQWQALYRAFKHWQGEQKPKSSPEAEAMARQFHEAYERLAPDFNYKTRDASAVPWKDVPEDNKLLMVAVCEELLVSINKDINDVVDRTVARYGKPAPAEQKPKEMTRRERVVLCLKKIFILASDGTILAAEVGLMSIFPEPDLEALEEEIDKYLIVNDSQAPMTFTRLRRRNIKTAIMSAVDAWRKGGE